MRVKYVMKGREFCKMNAVVARGSLSQCNEGLR